MSPGGVVVADFNADTVPDIAVANQSSNTVSVLLGNGADAFLPKVDYSAVTGAVDVKAADFNGDGKLDLAVVASGSVALLSGNGDGTFGAPSVNPVGLGALDRRGRPERRRQARRRDDERQHRQCPPRQRRRHLPAAERLRHPG
ncbi:MAG: VCBS repeat-containing protein [Isosphaeraceae bacterium]